MLAVWILLVLLAIVMVTVPVVLLTRKGREGAIALSDKPEEASRDQFIIEKSKVAEVSTGPNLRRLWKRFNELRPDGLDVYLLHNTFRMYVNDQRVPSEGYLRFGVMAHQVPLLSLMTSPGDDGRVPKDVQLLLHPDWHDVEMNFGTSNEADVRFTDGTHSIYFDVILSDDTVYPRSTPPPPGTLDMLKSGVLLDSKSDGADFLGHPVQVYDGSLLDRFDEGFEMVG